MAWESIGSVNTGELPEDADWIDFCQKLAIHYIKYVSEETHEGVSIGIMSHEHELGTYTSIGVHFKETPDWNYINACEE